LKHREHWSWLFHQHGHFLSWLHSLLEIMSYSIEANHPTSCWVETLVGDNIMGGFDHQFSM
jgi:hypothetical protein